MKMKYGISKAAISIINIRRENVKSLSVSVNVRKASEEEHLENDMLPILD
jgi:hypothetical protein